MTIKMWSAVPLDVFAERMVFDADAYAYLRPILDAYGPPHAGALIELPKCAPCGAFHARDEVCFKSMVLGRFPGGA